MRNSLSPVYALLAMASTLLLNGCDGGKAVTPSGPVILKGAGATAPYLAYAKWVAEYKKEDPAVDLKYQATGSGDGIRQLEAGEVDFAASDIPLSDAEIEKLKVKPYHFPTLVGAIVAVYNLPGLSTELKFTGDSLAGVFAGKIKSWNDPALAKANPDAALPAKRIVLIHRSDASGSTYALTDYLSQVSESWKSGAGRGATVEWPAGEGAKGNEAVAELVKKTPYSIGYVELNYAVEQKLPYGAVQNSAGQFRKPTLEALGAAVGSGENLRKDFRVSIVNAPAAEAYPICTLTWLVVPNTIPDAAKQKAMKRFLRWAYDSGIKLAMPMDYGILPPKSLDLVRDQIERIH
jgi:phosphate transport system substrate-binding protein